MVASHIQIQPDSTGKDVDSDALTSTEAGTPTVYRQDMIIADPVAYGSKAQVFPAGEVKVQPEPTQLFYDPYDAALDTVNRWNSPVTGNSAVAATITAGTLNLATGTVASGYSVLTTQPVFRSSTPGWIRFAYNVNLPDGAAPIANSYRFWGAAVPQVVPTTANPIVNGAGFEVSTAGKMYAVVYNTASRTAVQDLSSSGTNVQPLDANPHNYQIYYRPTNIYWYIDGALVATGSLAQSALSVDAMPSCYMAVGFSTPPVSSVSLNSNAASVSDTAVGNITISDMTYPWRRATVGKSGGISVKGTWITPLSLNVTANTPVNSSAVDVTDAGGVSFIIKNTTAGTGFTGVPVMVFEQSDDGTSWAPLPVTSISLGTSSSPVMTAGAANAEQVFDAALEGVSFVRVRVTTAQTANGMTVVIQPGGMPFSPVVSSIAPAPVTGTLTNVAASASSVTLLAANANRKQAIFYNDSSANLYLGYTASAVSVTSYTIRIPASGYYEIPWPVYTGQVNGIWDSAIGNLRITEAI
jgi:Glycosyl hydrolases family 16